MNTTFARRVALPVISVGILGSAAIGLAGLASAGTYSYQPTPRQGIVATPNTIARPSVALFPGYRWYNGGSAIDDTSSDD